MTTFLQFLANAAAHWQALASGFASFLVGIYVASRKKQLSSRSFWAVTLLCLFAATFLAWQDEHRNTETVEQEKAAAISREVNCQSDGKQDAAYQRGLLDSNLKQRSSLDQLQNLLAGQQSSINTCVVSLGKLNPVVDRRITVGTFPIGEYHSKKPFLDPAAAVPYLQGVVISVNTGGLTPAGRLTCTQPFEVRGNADLTRTIDTYMEVPSPVTVVNDHTIDLNAHSSGTWGPNRPIAFLIASKFPEITGCTFNPQT